MVKRFFKDSAIYTSAGVLSNGIAFLLFPFFAHVLKTREYGVIDIMGLLTTLAFLTVALEINQGLARYVAGLKKGRERSDYASTALLYSLASYTAFAVLVLALAEPLTNALLGPQVDTWVMRVGVIGMWAAGLLYVVQDQLRWQLRPKAFALVSVSNAAVTTSASAVFVLGFNAGALGALGGQLMGAVFALTLALSLSSGTYRMHFDRAKCLRMLRYSIPLVPSSVGVFLNAYADRLAIQHEGSLSQVGIYGVGFRVSIVITLLLMGVQGATTPLVLARHSDPATPRELAHVFRIFCAVGCLVFLALSVLAVPLVNLLAAPAYASASTVVPYLVLAALLSGLYVFAPGPTIAERTRIYAFVNVTAGLLNLGLAFALVPVLGIRGAGIATLASSALFFVSIMAFSQRLYPVPHEWRRLAAALTAATAIAVAARTLLDSGSASGLDPGTLLIRLLVCALGALLVGALLLNRRDLQASWEAVASFRRRAKLSSVDA